MWADMETLFFPRTQEMEGFPVHTEPCVADESLWSGVSVTQELTQGSPQTAAPSPSVQMLECPPCPRILKTSWEEEFAMELAGKHFGAEGVDCVMWGIAALSTNQTGLPLPQSPQLSSSTAASM